jgi:aquaporin TIP
LAVQGLSTKKLLIYTAAQLIGGLLAAYFLMTILGEIAQIGTPMPNLEIAMVADISSTVLIIAIEFVFAAMFMAVVLAVSKGTQLVGSMAAISVGGAVALVTFVGGPVTGGALNPAHYFGTAMISGTFDYILTYLVAIIVGAFAGALLFRLVVDQSD